MPEYLAPGVFVEETSFRAKSIEGVSTTTTGFVGPASSGPVTMLPDIVTSLSEFEQTYGSGTNLVYSDKSESPNYLWHAVRAFFAEGGKRLYVSRVFKPLKKKNSDGTADIDWEYAPIAQEDELSVTPNSDNLFRDGHARTDSTDKNIRIRARHPGASGNLRVRLTLKAGRNILSAVGASKTPSLGALNDLDLVWILDATPNSGKGKLYQANWKQDTSSWEFVDATGEKKTLSQLIQSAEPDLGDTVRIVTLTVSLLTRDGGSEIQSWPSLPVHPDHLTAGMSDSVFARFSTDPASTSDARNLALVFARNDAITTGLLAVKSLFPPDNDPSRSLDPIDLAQPTNDEAAKGLTAADKFSRGVSVDLLLSGGNDGQIPGATEYEGKSDPTKSYSTGLKQLEEIEDISIVAAPGSTWNYTSRQSDANAITLLLIAHAEYMRYRIAVLDCAQNQTISDVRNFRAKLDSKYAALYYPWVTVSDPISRVPVELPPSGFVAGIYARNDNERGVWKAPANEVVRLALGFESNISKAQQEVMNPEGINCFRFFEGRGNRLWGARTISSDPEWKYVNIRRYFAYLERSIDKGTQWAVFEPNGDQLWANIRRTIQDFLLNEWQSGALLGDKPEKAFFVRCDRSTMTQNDLDNGRLIALVGVAPLKPAEFVIFRIGQWTADSRS